MNDELKQELKRYGITEDGAKLQTIMIRQEEHEVPETLQEFLGMLKSDALRTGPHVFYDRYNEGELFDYNTLWLGLDESTLEEFDCTENAPYISFARNGQHSSYCIRLDDEELDNPIVYYLDAGDYEEDPHVLKQKGNEKQLRLVELFKEATPIF